MKQHATTLLLIAAIATCAAGPPRSGGVPRAHGSMYEAAGTDVPDLNSAGQNVWVEIEPDTEGDLERSISYADGELTVEHAGNYEMTYDLSFQGGANDVYQASISVDDSIQPECTQSRKASANDVGNMGGSCAVTLSAGGVLKIEMRSAAASPANPTIKFGTLVVRRM